MSGPQKIVVTVTCIIASYVYFDVVCGVEQLSPVEALWYTAGGFIIVPVMIIVGEGLRKLNSLVHGNGGRLGPE